MTFPSYFVRTYEALAHNTYVHPINLISINNDDNGMYITITAWLCGGDQRRPTNISLDWIAGDAIKFFATARGRRVTRPPVPVARFSFLLFFIFFCYHRGRYCAARATEKYTLIFFLHFFVLYALIDWFIGRVRLLNNHLGIGACLLLLLNTSFVLIMVFHWWLEYLLLRTVKTLHLFDFPWYIQWPVGFQMQGIIFVISLTANFAQATSTSILETDGKRRGQQMPPWEPLRVTFAGRSEIAEIPIASRVPSRPTPTPSRSPDFFFSIGMPIGSRRIDRGRHVRAGNALSK